MTDKYNPKNITPYLGKTFVTESGSKYNVTEEGRFSGRDSLEGSKIRAMAGMKNDFVTSGTIQCHFDQIDEEGYIKSLEQLEHSADDLEKYLQKEGQEIVAGKDLAICLVLENEDIDKTRRVGFKTSSIDKII